MPKCGSSFVLDIIQLSAKSNNFSYTNEIKPGQAHYFEDASKTNEYIHELSRKIDSLNRDAKSFITRHQHFIDLPSLIKTKSAMINIIRHPVDQYLSTFYYRRHGFKKDVENNEWSKYRLLSVTNGTEYLSFSECLEKGFKECTDPISEMLPYFCGQEAQCRKNKSYCKLRLPDILGPS